MQDSNIRLPKRNRSNQNRALRPQFVALENRVVLSATVTTNAASSVSVTGAALAGTVNPNGGTTNVSFQYGTSPTLPPTVHTIVGSGFSFPIGTTVDAAGDVFVADTYHNTVKEVMAGTGKIVTIGSGFNNPRGVAVDAAGDVFVADTGNQSVKEVLAGSGNTITIASGFSFPVAVAVDAAGDVFVADSHNASVQEVMAKTERVNYIGNGTTFYGASGVAVDAAGDVFVSGNGVWEVTAGTGNVRTIVPAFGMIALGVAVDNAGDIFITDNGNDVIKEVLAGTSSILTIGYGFNNPQNLSVDAAGDVFVADTGNNRVVELSTPTIVATPATVSGSASTSVSGTLAGLAPATYYYRAVASGSGWIGIGATLSFTTLGIPAIRTTPATTVTSSGATLNGAVNGNGGTSTVAFQYSTSPSFTPTIQATVAWGLSSPGSVAVDQVGDVFVADSSNNAVKEIMAGSGIVKTIGSGFLFPSGVAVDSAGDVFAADTGHNTIKEVLSGTGRIVTIGSGFKSPYGVAVDTVGNVFVADTGNNAVDEVLVGSGIIQIIWQAFSHPDGVAVDAKGNVFVADTYHGAVKEILAGTKTVVTIGSGLSNPHGVAIDSAGDVFFADTGNNTVKEVLAGTTTAVTLGSGFKNPSGIAVDGIGDVFIADAGNNRVVELSPTTIAATPTSVNGSTTTAILAAISGLTASTKYYYRAIASGVTVYVAGSTLSFTTNSSGLWTKGGGASSGITNAAAISFTATSAPSLTNGTPSKGMQISIGADSSTTTGKARNLTTSLDVGGARTLVSSAILASHDEALASLLSENSHPKPGSFSARKGSIRWTDALIKTS